jgi:hypothetical protein
LKEEKDPGHNIRGRNREALRSFENAPDGEPAEPQAQGRQGAKNKDILLRTSIFVLRADLIKVKVQISVPLPNTMEVSQFAAFILFFGRHIMLP